ncbi:Ubiquinone/menaquinone biosynthesis C-methyltransferase UbiE [Achromobacter veterisilvae]|uniref:Ubiquinone/menaquinone biosynthesis C-methyltransferase UbiE n=2 Tax=Achromobacter veterisilvae TaxID=2069367 RepID=A0A446CCH6_9BURK|nr:Ubiquinone/menaquinone biosynthesis C-methyltransferase UbiE [Achromobacter veterisilvae]
MASSSELGPASRLYQPYLKAGHRILEIGSSSGTNLSLLTRGIGIDAYGIDPSETAVIKGHIEFPELHLSVGTADQLDFPDGYFDFILFGFCLYLVDRTLLTKTIAEADRCLKDGGHIAITDFRPDVPTTRPYKHFEGLISYKYPYEQIFLAFPHFQLVESRTFSHSEDAYHADPQERVSASVIRKSLQEGYQQL